MGGSSIGSNGVVVSVQAPRRSRMPHDPSYNLRQAAGYTGLSVRHVRRLLDAARVEFTFARGVRHYDRARIEEWRRVTVIAMAMDAQAAGRDHIRGFKTTPP
jgi:hypothetical protein